MLPKAKKGESLKLNWILPPFIKGEGGPMNILRYIKHLEQLGYLNRIYILGPSIFKSDDEVKRFVNKEFFKLDADIFLFNNNLKDSDGLIATSWETAYVVNYFGNTYKKFYFIQDYEPFFYPVGVESLLAQNTYSFDFTKITMGRWIGEHLKNNFNLPSQFLEFGYDPEIYGKNIKLDRKSSNQVFFYARPYSPRRCFELGIEGLRELRRRGIDFKLYTAGQELNRYNIPFSYEGLGVLEQNDLAQLYSNIDVGLVLSPTNTSLLPFEMMASGCAVLELDSSSNRSNFTNKDVLSLVGPSPSAMADKLEKLLKDEKKRKEQVRNAYEFVKSLTWENSTKKLDSIFRTEMEN